MKFYGIKLLFKIVSINSKLVLIVVRLNSKDLFCEIVCYVYIL